MCFLIVLLMFFFIFMSPEQNSDCWDVIFSLRRLAKSTLLLIPLFGIHYVVFVTLGESIAENQKIFFDLALGSFQVNLVSAVLHISCMVTEIFMLHMHFVILRVWWWPFSTVF